MLDLIGYGDSTWISVVVVVVVVVGGFRRVEMIGGLMLAGKMRC